MAGNTNTLSKKTIVAIVIAIVLLFVASLSVGIFLANRGDAEAAGGNQISDVNQTENNNQNTSSDNNQAPDQNTNIENNNTNSNNTENNNTENNNPETPNTDGNAGTVVDNNETTNNNTNNNGTVNNAGNNTENRTNNNTAGVTTDANVNQVGETTVTRVEEREKLVSRAYWDWWKPMTVALTKSNVGVNQPELSVKKTVITEVAGNKFVYAGQEMTYVIAVTNNSDEDVKDIEITDKIPEKTTFVSIEDATVDGESVGTKTTVVNENTVLGVKWKVTVPAGKTVIARFTVQVNKEMLVETDNGEIAEVPTTGTISNVAIANGEESKDPTNKPDEGGETKVAIITAKKSSEIIRFERQIQENEKEAAELGDLIEYTITVENTGDIEGTTYIQDNVPAGTEFVSAEGDAIISEEKDMVAWSITLGANETITRRFVVRVIDTKNTIKNTATVGGNSTNTDEIETIDYTITKTAELKKDPLNDSEGYAKEAEIGDVIEYTITVTNNGSKTLEDINVIDDMLDLNDKITLEPNENKTYTISHEVTKDDIKNAKDSGKIYNYAVAIYDQRDEYDKTSTDARTDYYYTIYHVEKDNPSNVLGTNTGSAELAAEVTVAEREFTGYECDGKSSETIKIDTENNVAYVYYTRIPYGYTIYHVEKGNIDNVLDKDIGTAEYESEVEVNSKTILGYKYDHKSADTIKIDTENNVAYVYYTRNSYGYTIYHVEKDNPENVLDTVTETAEYEDVIAVTEKTFTGYECDGKSSETIKIDTENNVAYVYYTRIPYGYTIYHVEKGNIDNVLDKDTGTAAYESEVEVNSKTIPGYKYDHKSADTIEIDTENNVAYVYYTRNSYGYTIYHVEKDNPGNVLDTVTETAEYEDVITVTEKEFTGYKYDSKSAEKIKIDTENNVAYVYYTRNSYGYTIYHVEEGNEDNVLGTDTGTAEYEDVITVTEKTFTGYEYDSKSVDKIKIDTENNVAYVYYTRNSYGYTIYHVEKDNPEKVLDKDTGTAAYESEVEVNSKTIPGYEYDHKSADTIKIDTENNVAYVYYEKLYTYTVEYYFNGVKNDNYTISSETLANVSISFDRPKTLDGYTYISYVGFDGILNGSMTTTTGTNIIRVDYGKAVTTIQKEATQSVNAGEEIEYTITVKNTGYLPATVTVRDELKGTTYVEDSANIEPIITETTIAETTTQTLEWKNVQVSAATDAVREQTTTITFKVKTANASFGTVIENRADIVDGDSSNTVTTTVNEITVKSSEYKEGQKGSDLNIIFVLDNSSSMNETIEGVSYLNNGSNYVAPGDEPKTRIYNAKKAVKEFIDKQNSNTTMSVITFNTNTEAGITNNMATLVKEGDIKSKTETRKGLFGIEYEVTIRYTVLNGKEYEVSDRTIRATDGKDYYYILPDINYGPTVVGTNTGANAVSNSELKAKVDNISISSERSGFGTYVGRAFKLINNNTNTYISKDKKNIVIVLADGDFSENYNGSLTTLKQKVDEVYCIGFGSGEDYNETKLVEMSTNNKCYKASNAGTLLKAFEEIEESASGTEKTGTTVQGRITLTATKEIKVSTECPIIVTYNTGSVDESGNPIMAELFKCTSTADLAKYGLTITNKNTLTWDAKVYVQNTGSTVPSTVYLKYYIPRSNG